MPKQWLIDIPPELRLLIYKHYFTSLKITLHWLPGSGGVSHCDSNRWDRLLPRLLLTSKKVKSEAYPVFFAQTVFRISECCCWWDSLVTYKFRPVSFEKVRNISFAVHEAEFVRRWVLPGRHFGRISVRGRREVSTRAEGENQVEFCLGGLLIWESDVSTEKRFIRAYSQCTNHLEYNILYRMLQFDFFEVRIAVKNNARVILSYNAGDITGRVATFEKEYLPDLQLIYEDLGYQFRFVRLVDQARTASGTTTPRGERSDRGGSPQLIESTAGCIVC